MISRDLLMVPDQYDVLLSVLKEKIEELSVDLTNVKAKTMLLGIVEQLEEG